MAEHAHTTNPSSLSRRALALGSGAFASVGLIAGAAASMPAPQPDAELIAIGAEAAPLIVEHERLGALWWATPADDEHRGAISALGKQTEPVANRLFELTNRSMALPATTLAGAKVKAMLIQDVLRVEHETHGGMLEFETSGAEAVWSLVTDLLAMGRA